FQCGEEILDPSISVTMLKRARPDAELFHVVAHGRHAIRVRVCSVAQVRGDLLDGAEGNQVAQYFLAGNQADGLTFVLGDVVTEELLGLKAGGKKVNVVEHRVADVGVGQDRGELRFPNALCKPCASRTLAEVVLDVIGEANDLHPLVRGGNGDQDRLVKPSAHHLDLTVPDQSSQALKIFGVML